MDVMYDVAECLECSDSDYKTWVRISPWELSDVIGLEARLQRAANLESA